MPRPISHQPKLMHLTEARLFIKFLAGASLLMSFHRGGHCRPGYDVTHASFLAGCTRRLPSIIAYHYHTHHPAAWTIISKYISKLRWFCTCFRGREFNIIKSICTIKFPLPPRTTRSTADTTLVENWLGAQRRRGLKLTVRQQHLRRHLLPATKYRRYAMNVCNT